MEPGAYAADVLPIDSDMYSIAEATTTSTRRNIRKIGSVVAATVIVRGNYQPDMTLLKVKPVRHSKTYDNIPALPITRYVNEPPEPGTPVAFYSVPASVSQRAVKGVGQYLGRIKDPDGEPQKVDVFCLPVTDARKNPAQHGGSGSSAIVEDGHVFSPLVTMIGRNQRHLPFDHPGDPYDNVLRYRMSEALKVQTDACPVLVNSVVPSREVFYDLIDGFDTPIPVR